MSILVHCRASLVVPLVLMLPVAPLAMAQAQQAPAANPAPAATAGIANSSAKPRSTAEDNPFPEDVSKQAAQAAAADEKADRKAAASGAVTEDEVSSSSRDKLKDLDLLGDHDSRIDNGSGGVVLNTKLSDDDLRVGSFYMQTGDYKGAYDRFKEAVAVNPDNPEAVFRLGEAARKLNRKDEALANYEVYLAALPDGPRAKNIRKVINEMASKK